VLDTVNFLNETSNVSKSNLTRERKSKCNKIFSGNKLHNFGAGTLFLETFSPPASRNKHSVIEEAKKVTETLDFCSSLRCGWLFKILS
jgi:hypothetical protein